MTRLIRQWRAGEAKAQHEFLAAVYDDLRRLAAAFMRSERAGHTLPPTGLVHEAFLRMERDDSSLGLADALGNLGMVGAKRSDLSIPTRSARPRT